MELAHGESKPCVCLHRKLLLHNVFIMNFQENNKNLISQMLLLVQVMLFLTRVPLFLAHLVLFLAQLMLFLAQAVFK